MLVGIHHQNYAGVLASPQTYYGEQVIPEHLLRSSVETITLYVSAVLLVICRLADGVIAARSICVYEICDVPWFALDFEPRVAPQFGVVCPSVLDKRCKLVENNGGSAPSLFPANVLLLVLVVRCH